jgi:hypothetical protein
LEIAAKDVPLKVPSQGRVGVLVSQSSSLEDNIGREARVISRAAISSDGCSAAMAKSKVLEVKSLNNSHSDKLRLVLRF